MAAEQPKMAVKVYEAFKIHFDGEAYSVSAMNDVGPFDVLPHHHNFISILGAGNVVVRATDGKTHTVRVARALMHVKADRVVVFVDI